MGFLLTTSDERLSLYLYHLLPLPLKIFIIRIIEVQYLMRLCRLEVYMRVPRRRMNTVLLVDLAEVLWGRLREETVDALTLGDDLWWGELIGRPVSYHPSGV